jgi:hypothetical protein
MSGIPWVIMAEVLDVIRLKLLYMYVFITEKLIGKKKKRVYKLNLSMRFHCRYIL